MFKVGIGYDSHKIVKNKMMILGGVSINSDFGLAGHSDADVLLHAVIDGMLGACGLPDIGSLFPDTEKKYENISSLKLLENVKDKIENKFEIVNIDSIIIAESPKLNPYFNEMKENISEILNMNIRDINIKAKSNEGMGFIGRKEGIASFCSVLVKEI